MAELAQSHLPADTPAVSRLGAFALSETRLFTLGAGLVALHVADDNFLQPQPGTSAGDHLVSGLVPLAVLFAATMAYPRLRPGLRAAIAVPLGVLGVVAGVEAFHYTRAVGPSGDDYTGLLAIPAGLLLVGIGVVTLWRTRRKDDSLLRRYLRRLLLLLGALAVTAYVVFPLSFSYVVTHTARAVVPPAKLGVAYEQVAFTTSDGLRLERLVRALQERRGGDHVSGTQGSPEAGQDACPPRLRRAAVRPAR